MNCRERVIDFESMWCLTWTSCRQGRQDVFQVSAEHVMLVALVLSVVVALAAPIRGQLPSAPSLPILQHLTSSTPLVQSNFGQYISLLADIDGDGKGEILIGENGPALSPISRATVRSGATGSILMTYVGAGTPQSPVITSGRTIGDITVDGKPEFALLRAALPPSSADFQLFDGATGVLLGTLIPSNSITTLNDLSTIDDLDGDGVPEFCVGSTLGSPPGVPLTQAQGAVFVYHGLTHSLLYRIDPAPGISGFGRLVESVGDIDGDGIGDLAISHTTGTMIYSCQMVGAVMVSSFPGATSGITSAGDWDGDGLGDVFVASPGDLVGTPAGPVTIRAGSSGVILASISPPVSGMTMFGAVSRTIGDVDGDGSKDFVVTAPGGAYVANGVVGIAYVYSAAAHAMLFEVSGLGLFGFGRLSRNVDGGRDIDGDGLDDFAIADSLFLGYVRIFSGHIAMSELSAAGTVRMGTQPLDVLYVAQPLVVPSSGGYARTVSVPVGTALSIFMARPPQHVASSASHIVFGRVGGTPTLSEWQLPFGIGRMCLEPWLLSPSDPSLFFLCNTFGTFPALTAAVPAHLPPPGNQVMAFYTLPVPMTFLLQGVIEDSSSFPVPLSVTNAVRVVVH